MARHGSADATELLTTSEDFAALRPEWEALHAAVPGATPFTHPAWHAAWLAHFAETSRALPVFLSVRLGEALAGVAALDLQSAAGATLLGDPKVRDYGGPLVLPGHEQAVARGVLEWLGEDMTPALTLWGMPTASLVRAAFTAAADAFGWSAMATPEADAPCAALPGSFDAYVAGLAKHDRHELRRKLRHLEAAGTVTFETAEDPVAIAAAMPALFAMMRASHDGKARFLDARMEAFFTALATDFGALGMACLATLRLDGVPVAMLFAFQDAGARYLYNSGYGPEFGHLAPGLLSKALAIRDSIDTGRHEFHFLRGDEPYKAHLGGQPFPLVTLALRGHEGRLPG